MERRRAICLVICSLLVMTSFLFLLPRFVVSSSDPENPTFLQLNEWTDLGSTANDYYTAVYGLRPVMFEINRSQCNNYVSFDIYSDDSYSNDVFSGICSSSQGRMRVFSQRSDDYYYFKTSGPVSGCDPFIPSSIVTRLGQDILSLDENYAIEAKHVNPTFYYLQITTGRRYQVSFTAETENTDLEFEFIYADNGVITEQFENITLYNNGYFTAKKSALALVSIRAYQSGSYNFDFQISEVEDDQPLDSTQMFMIITFSGVAAMFSIIAVYRYKKQGKVF